MSFTKNKFISFTFLVLFFSLIVMACIEEEGFNPIEQGGSSEALISPFAPLLGSDYANRLSSHVFFMSEGIIGAEIPNSYRIQGVIKESENESLIASVDQIEYGGLAVPALTREVEGESEIVRGVFNHFLSRQSTPEDFNLYEASLNQQTRIEFIDQGEVVDELLVSNAGFLPVLAIQDNQRLVDLPFVDQEKEITIKWNVRDNNDSGRSGGVNMEEFVGAMIVYSPFETERVDGDLGDRPSESVSVEKIGDYDLGSLTFTADDLALLPTNSMVTVYIGNVRYEVDDNGNLVSSPAGTTVVSGGVQGSSFVRINIP